MLRRLFNFMVTDFLVTSCCCLQLYLISPFLCFDLTHLTICVQKLLLLLLFFPIQQPTVCFYLFDVLSVCAQDAVRRLKPLNPVSLSVSSRTDSGVHALSNSAHFDLQRKNDKPPFAEDVLVEALNFHLRSEQIR